MKTWPGPSTFHQKSYDKNSINTKQFHPLSSKHHISSAFLRHESDVRDPGDSGQVGSCYELSRDVKGVRASKMAIWAFRPSAQHRSGSSILESFHNHPACQSQCFWAIPISICNLDPANMPGASGTFPRPLPFLFFPVFLHAADFTPGFCGTVAPKKHRHQKDHPKVAALRLLPLSLRHDLSQDRELGVQSGGSASWHSGSEALATYGKHAVWIGLQGVLYICVHVCAHEDRSSVLPTHVIIWNYMCGIPLGIISFYCANLCHFYSSPRHPINHAVLMFVMCPTCRPDFARKSVPHMWVCIHSSMPLGKHEKGWYPFLRG